MGKTVLTYGTFDLFHVGHLRLLERCKNLGDRLVVGCSTDEFNTLKGKKTVLPFEDRAEILRACRHVDHVFAENSWEQKRGDIVKFNIDTFVMGDDWAGKFDDLSDICAVMYLPRTPDISTTDIKSFINKVKTDKLTAVQQTIDRLIEQVKAI